MRSKIRCDGESSKILKFWRQLINKGQIRKVMVTPARGWWGWGEAFLLQPPAAHRKHMKKLGRAQLGQAGAVCAVNCELWSSNRPCNHCRAHPVRNSHTRVCFLALHYWSTCNPIPIVSMCDVYTQWRNQGGWQGLCTSNNIFFLLSTFNLS